MAATVKQDTYIETLSGPIDVIGHPRTVQMPINPTERKWRARRGMRAWSARALDVLHSTRRSAGRLFDQARTQAADSYTRLSQKTGELTRQTQYVARYARQEYPVRMLTVIAGTAFMAGAAIRIWRSRQP